MRKRAWAIFCALLIPLIPFAAWVLLNHQYPISDASEVALISNKIFGVWDKGSFWDTVKACYFVRDDLKPVLYPALVSPIFILMSGDVLWSVRICCILTYAVYLLVCFLGFEMVLPAAESALATILMGLMPWSVSSAHFYNIEIPSLTMNLAALYWLWKARNLEDRKPALALGFSFGVSLCMRPAEAINFFIMPMLLLFAFAIRAGKMRARDALLWIAALAPFVVVFAREHATWTDSPLTVGAPLVWRILLLLGPAVLLFFFRKKIGLNSAFAHAAVTVIALITLWYAPAMNRLHFWILAGTYSDVAVSMDPTRAGFWVFPLVGRWLLGLPFIPLVLLAIPAFVFGIPKRYSAVLKMVVPCVLLPLIVGMSAHNHTVRYYYSSVWLLEASILFLVLSPEVPLRKWRASLTAVCAASLLAWGLWTVFGTPLELDMVNSADGELYYRKAPLRFQDPTFEWTDKLTRLYPDESTKVGIYTPGIPMHGESSRLEFGVFRTEMIANELGFDWKFDFYETPIDFNFYNTHDILVYGPFPSEIEMNEEARAPYFRAFSKFGWQLGKNFEVDYHGQVGKFYVFTKIPGWKVPTQAPKGVFSIVGTGDFSMEKVEKLYREQLKKMGLPLPTQSPSPK